MYGDRDGVWLHGQTDDDVISCRSRLALPTLGRSAFIHVHRHLAVPGSTSFSINTHFWISVCINAGSYLRRRRTSLKSKYQTWRTIVEILIMTSMVLGVWPDQALTSWTCSTATLEHVVGENKTLCHTFCRLFPHISSIVVRNKNHYEYPTPKHPYDLLMLF